MSSTTHTLGVQGRAPQFSKQTVAPADVLKFRSEKETNEHRLENRGKQIQFGKNTVGYDNYIAAVPKNQRKKIPAHPRTPDIHKDMSKRQFDGIVKAWRRALHTWDNPDVRPDLNPEAVKLEVKQPSVEFDETKKIGQKRKINQENTNDAPSSNKMFAREGSMQEISEVDQGKFTIAEELLNDGYVSGDANINDEVDDDDDVL